MRYLDLPESERIEILRIADLCIDKVNEWARATYSEIPVWLDRVIVGSLSHGDATLLSDVDLVLVPQGDLGIALSTGDGLRNTRRIIRLCARQFNSERLLDGQVLCPELFIDRDSWRPIAYSLNYQQSVNTREDWKALYAVD